MMRLLAAAVLYLFAGLAQATIITLGAHLDGPSEAPPNASPGTGSATVIYDDVAHTLRVIADFTGLTGITAAAHIHCCTAAPNTGTANVATQTPSFVQFPIGVTFGSFDQTLDLTLATSFRAGFITDNGGTPATAEVALAAGLLGQRAYFNIHTSTFGGGEIRGFLVPEPGTLALIGLGLALSALAIRRRRIR